MLAVALLQLRTSLRSLLRAPAFSLAVVASLALSVGAVTTVYAVVDAVLLKALPYRDPERLVWISSVRPQRADAPFTLPELMDYSADARTLDILGYTSWSAAMATAGAAQRLSGIRISANAFEVLGMTPTAGRLLRRDDDRPDAARTVVLSRAFWLSQFGGSDSIVGKTIRLNDQPYHVAGVLPRHFPLPFRGFDVVAPLSPDLDPLRHVRTSVNFLRLIGRIRPGATPASAQRELTAIADTLRARFPAEYANKIGAHATPLQEYLVGNSRQTLRVMLGAAGLLLGIALANVLNLLLIRGIGKQGEMALRRALGGVGRDLALAVGVEAAVLAAAGSMAGAALAAWCVALLSRTSLNVPRLGEAQVDARVLGVTIGIVVFATILFSALSLAAASRVDPRAALSAAGRGQGGARGQSRVRAGLLMAQLALAAMLSVVTTTMVGSVIALQRVDLGYRPDSAFVALLSLPQFKFRVVADVSRFTREFQAAVESNPEVLAVGAISVAPLSGLLRSVPFTVEGRTPAQANERLDANYRSISPGYFRAVGATLTKGRDFEASDNDANLRVAIVSRALAEKFIVGGAGDAIGRRVLVDDNNVGPRPLTIVGVVDDMRHVSIDGAPTWDVFLPVAQTHPDGLSLVAGSQFWTVRLRTPASAASTYPGTFARTLAATDRDVASARMRPLRDYVDDFLAPRRFSAASLIGFASVALALATLGVFGTVGYSVAQRRREIGLRLALGSTPAGVVRHVMQPVLAIAVVGVVLGMVGVVVTRKAVAGLLFGVAATEPLVLAGVSLSLLAISALAAALPAQRAAKIAPVTVLAGD